MTNIIGKLLRKKPELDIKKLKAQANKIAQDKGLHVCTTCGSWGRPRFKPLCRECYRKKVGSVAFNKEQILYEMNLFNDNSTNKELTQWQREYYTSYYQDGWIPQTSAGGTAQDVLRHLLLLVEEGKVEIKKRVTKNQIRFWFKLK